MSKKTIILTIIAFVALVALSIFSVIMLFNGTGEEEKTPTIDVTLPSIYNEFDESLDVPVENIQEQLSEVDKTGFDSQTTYWLNKLREVLPEGTTLENEMNNEETIEELCKKYFPNEYREYKLAFLLGDDTKEEYPESENNDLYLMLLRMAQTGDYNGVIRHVDVLLKNYKFTMPHNYNIGNLYRDAIALNNLRDMSEEMKIKTIGNLSDPVMQLIAVVFESPKAQCTMIKSLDSIYFKSNTRIEIQNIETASIASDTTDYHGILMSRYYNNTSDSLDYVKVQFKINFDLSDYTPDYFFPHFDQVNENNWIIKDENGNMICDLNGFDETALENWITEYPKYEEQAREVYQNMISENNSDDSTNTDINDSFMYKPVEEESSYDYKKYEKFKEIVYEAYIPKMEIAAGNFNRLYLIKQISDSTDYFKTIKHYNSTYSHDIEIQMFLRDNEWLHWDSEHFIDLEEGLMEGEVPETTVPVDEKIEDENDQTIDPNLEESTIETTEETIVVETP